ncbi:hypothetical protein WA1_43050 [Scytonema hofmannii PCC 7110]|uniref:Bacteriocin n=1 Tax=Scytonema hofmannii PCC 7110 TaxID=128403 RepID=A0A139WVM5_9CYAN|nr:hypothetical protein [Scytonema hofmannii]KYC36478.1 hypothetical protein WA1_43050 [Scytonema hofmannii PCC 7110]
MAKITISQLQTADATSMQELTNSEINATKGGIVVGLGPVVNLTNTAVGGQADTFNSTNTVGQNLVQSLLGVIV